MSGLTCNTCWLCLGESQCYQVSNIFTFADATTARYLVEEDADSR